MNLIECTITDCGQPYRSKVKIVGGTETEVNEYPWQAGIVSSRVSRTKPFCGGTLVNDRFVLTAAHCDEYPLQTIEVLLGEHDHTQTDESVELRVAAKSFKRHPNYDSYSVDNDFALIELKHPVDFACHEHIRPACLPTVDVPEGSTMTITGWGTLSQGGSQPDVLQEAQITKVSDADCESAYPGDITVNMFCAGNVVGGGIAAGIDSCQGDSGGPCVYLNGNNYELSGVTSWGYGCAQAGFPGVYADVLKLSKLLQ